MYIIGWEIDNNSVVDYFRKDYEKNKNILHEDAINNLNSNLKYNLKIIETYPMSYICLKYDKNEITTNDFNIFIKENIKITVPCLIYICDLFWSDTTILEIEEVKLFYINENITKITSSY